MNNKYHFPIAIMLITSSLRKNNIKFGFIGVSVGSELDLLSKLLLKTAVRKCSFFFVRDIKSKLTIEKEFNIIDKIKLCPDFATLASSSDLASDNKCNYVGINISEYIIGSNYTKYQKVLNYIVKCCESLLDRGVSVIFFTTGEYSDYKTILELVSKYDLKVKVVHPKSLSELKKIINNSTFTINMRLHASIISMVEGKKAYNFDYLDKIEGYYRTNGLNNWLIDLESYSFEFDDEYAITLQTYLAKTRKQMDLCLTEIKVNY